jgi:hypothetical protein
VLPIEIAPGLLRWTAAHPEWDPAAPPGSAMDWPQQVGSVLYELPHVAVLIDPQLPARAASVEREELLAWLDERVAGRAVTILTTIRWHRRDRDELAQRYADTTTRAPNWVPPGVEPWPVRGARETLFWLPGAGSLVPGDSVIGTDDGLRVCPESWLKDARVGRAGLAERMRALLELPIDRVLVSHGEPVLLAGHVALAEALEEARGG